MPLLSGSFSGGCTPWFKNESGRAREVWFQRQGMGLSSGPDDGEGFKSILGLDGVGTIIDGRELVFVRGWMWGVLDDRHGRLP